MQVSSHIIGALHKSIRNQAESSRRTDEFELAVELLLAYVVYSNTGKRSTSTGTSNSTVTSTSATTSTSTVSGTSTDTSTSTVSSTSTATSTSTVSSTGLPQVLELPQVQVLAQVHVLFLEAGRRQHGYYWNPGGAYCGQKLGGLIYQHGN